MLQDGMNSGREIQFKRLVEMPERRFFSAAAFHEDRIVIAAGDGRLQIHPAAMEGAGHGSLAVRIAAQFSHQPLEFRGKDRSMPRIFA